MAAENPFPGMNPYLEQRWSDVHTRLVTYCADLIQELLPDDLRARMQERVFIESGGRLERGIYPDVEVYERPPAEQGAVPARGAQSAGGGSTTVTPPLVIRLPNDEVTQPYLEIIDARTGGRVVTSVEFVSPSNKAAGAGRRLYLRKQEEAQGSDVNLVEVDLLRAGRPVTIAEPHVARQRRATYHASVWRAHKPFQVEYYPVPLRQPLPRIPIPLRTAEADVALDLQHLINLCYRRGRYDDINYAEPVTPTLNEGDAAWANQMLKDKSLL
jgi:hypothetical protein